MPRRRCHRGGERNHGDHEIPRGPDAVFLGRLIPNVRLQMIVDGHLFMLTRPVEAGRMIEAFLTER
jgi:hypothetical protein